MKRIKLRAYFYQNLGDDLMVDILLRRYPQYMFWTNNSSPATDVFLKYPNFENRACLCSKYGRQNHIANCLTLYKNTDFFLRKMFQKREKECCCGVYIGGSLYMQRADQAIAQQIAAEEEKLEPDPLFVIGANFGPYITDDFREAFAGYFERCGGVTFRDQASYTQYAHLPNVAYAPDVVFNLQDIPEKSGDNSVIISVINLPDRKVLAGYSEAYDAFIVRMCQTCVDQGKTPILMSFCESEGDPAAIDRICNHMDSALRDHTEIYLYKGDIQEAVSLIAGADFVVATRFHAMILALKLGKPFFAISYSDKVKWVMDDLHCDAYCNIRDVATVQPEDILEQYKNPVDITDYAKKAEKQFEQFDRFMQEI